jgi:two-component system, NtrC family, response regulator AtoC
MAASSETAKETNGLPGGSRGLLLVVLGEDHMSTHPLAAGAEIVIGRDAACDVPLEHPKISRRHAIVRAGSPPTVEDAGSTNGVYLGTHRLARGERRQLLARESILVGPFTVFLTGSGPAPQEPLDGRAALVVRDPQPDALSPIVTRIAQSDIGVLVQGETGAGKDILARSLHALSGRRGRLVAINCAAVSESLLESELFGHEKGAFTGAVQAKPGLFEAAAAGTVFLDEIGDLPLAVQAKLLRAIEARQVLRLGSVRPVDLDVRFIAATHRDLRTAVADGAFRHDLYFRINGVTLIVPPLRECRERIVPLAEKLLAEAAARTGEPKPTLSASAIDALNAHDWPGNVRELKVVVERAILMCGDAVISSRHIVLDAPLSARAVGGEPDEKQQILAALERCAGNQTRAAKLLGISRATLANKLAIHRIPRPQQR